MDNHVSKSQTDRSGRLRFVPWRLLEHHTSSAFTLAGMSLFASLFVPIGLGTFAEWSWLAGIVLVGLGVVAVALGLLGLYSRTDDRSPRLAAVGAVSAVVAGTAGLVLLALSGLTAGAMVLPSIEFPVGMQSFAAIALTMAGGYALGLLSYGILALRSDAPPGRAGLLLTGGGVLVLVPVIGALLQLGFGVDQPPRILFPLPGLVAIDTAAVGVSLRTESNLPGG
jgi:hypothetical protein